MKKQVIALFVLFSSTLAFAKGGMIGGGEVSFKSVLECKSTGIDPTHSAAPFVWVVKEVDYEGKFIADATLRVVTMDANLKPIHYYVTHETDVMSSPDNGVAITLWNYDLGSSDNKKIGTFSWDEQSKSGVLTASGNGLEELQLTDCSFTN